MQKIGLERTWKYHDWVLPTFIRTRKYQHWVLPTFTNVPNQYYVYIFFCWKKSTYVRRLHSFRKLKLTKLCDRCLGDLLTRVAFFFPSKEIDLFVLPCFKNKLKEMFRKGSWGSDSFWLIRYFSLQDKTFTSSHGMKKRNKSLSMFRLMIKQRWK